MRDEELKRNGSGYYDETAYKAMTAGPQPGEIWQGHNDRIYLILAREDSVCSTLLLDEKKTNHNITVMARVPMYTTPIMVGFSFTGKLAQYIKTVPEDEMRAIRLAVGTALGCAAALGDALKTQARNQETEKLMMLEEKNACLAAENDELRNELDGYSRIVEEANEARRRAQKGEVYREMYLELLDRFVAAGGDAHG